METTGSIPKFTDIHPNLRDAPMMQWIYTELGFFGSILFSLFIFALFILWLAGVAGIVGMEHQRHRDLKLAASICLPLFPILWILWDIRRHRRIIQGLEP
jgi:FtsH-binding integral membrane protein